MSLVKSFYLLFALSLIAIAFLILAGSNVDLLVALSVAGGAFTLIVLVSVILHYRCPFCGKYFALEHVDNPEDNDSSEIMVSWKCKHCHHIEWRRVDLKRWSSFFGGH